jgi:hypothetical protein
MNYSVPFELAEQNRRVLSLAITSHLNHRLMTIEWACDLEVACAKLLFRFFESRGCHASWESAEKDLFGENKMLSSLTRMSKLVAYLKLLDDDEVSDLRVFARLRNMYAHSNSRGQFQNDGESAALVRKLVLYRNSPSLQQHDEQGIYLSCVEFLKRRIDDRRDAIRMPD